VRGGTLHWRRWQPLDLLAAVGGTINLVVVGWIFTYWLLN